MSHDGRRRRDGWPIAPDITVAMSDLSESVEALLNERDLIALRWCRCLPVDVALKLDVTSVTDTKRLPKSRSLAFLRSPFPTVIVPRDLISRTSAYGTGRMSKRRHFGEATEGYGFFLNRDGTQMRPGDLFYSISSALALERTLSKRE
jgi:hypothetical protein